MADGRILTRYGGRGVDEDSYRSYLPPEVGAMLARHRRARGWSVREAGRRVGCAHGTIGDLERSRRAPSWPLAMDICEAYGLAGEDASELLACSVRGAGRDGPFYVLR